MHPAFLPLKTSDRSCLRPLPSAQRSMQTPAFLCISFERGWSNFRMVNQHASLEAFPINGFTAVLCSEFATAGMPTQFPSK